MYYIYLTTNLVNNKKYIGLHKVNENKGDYYLGSGKILKQAIEKYGRENFSKQILEYCETLEEANILEQQYISKYNAVEDNNFYNLAKGGDCGGIYYYQNQKQEHPEEAKEHQEKRLKALKKQQEKNYDKMVEIGKQNIQKCIQQAKDHPEEMKAIQEKNKEINTEHLKKQEEKNPELAKENRKKGEEALKKQNEEHPEESKYNLSLGPQANKLKNGKRVRCINTGEIFLSQRDAENYYHLNKDAIRKCLKGITKSAGKHPETKEKLLQELVEKEE